MSGAMLGSRRIRCGWAQHKQETSSASYAAVDRVSARSMLHAHTAATSLICKAVLPYSSSRHAVPFPPAGAEAGASSTGYQQNTLCIFMAGLWDVSAMLLSTYCAELRCCCALLIAVMCAG